MILQDPDPIPPVLPVEVRAQSIPRVLGTQASGEWAGASLCLPWEAHIIYLGLVYHLADHQPTPVDCGIHPMHAATVCRHGPHIELNSTLWVYDSS